MRNEELFDDWLLDNKTVLMSDFIERKVWEEWQNYLEEEFTRWLGDQSVRPHNQRQGNEGTESPEPSGNCIEPLKGGDENGIQ